MKTSRLMWAFIGCFASLSVHAQVTIVDAADYVAVMAETPEANEVSVIPEQPGLTVTLHAWDALMLKQRIMIALQR